MLSSQQKSESIDVEVLG